MDPLRGVIHLGLKLTETTLDRAVEVVRLADAVLVASAVPPVRESASDTPVWPEEEQADLDALSATLRARQGSEPTPARRAAATKAIQEQTPASAAPARTAAPKKSAAAKTSAATKTSPGKKATAKKTTKAATSTSQKKAPAKKAPARKATAKKTPAKKAPARKATAKKTTSTQTTPRKATR